MFSDGETTASMLNTFKHNKSNWRSLDGVLIRESSLDDSVVRVFGLVEPSKFRSACVGYFENLGDVIPVGLPVIPKSVYLNHDGESWFLVGEYEYGGWSS